MPTPAECLYPDPQPGLPPRSQANNCVEQKEWMDILSKVCAHNQDKTEQYHPGQFRETGWTCCRTPTQNAIGCAPVTADKLHADIKLATDSDREMERLYALFLAHLDQLGRLKGTARRLGLVRISAQYHIAGQEIRICT